MKRFLIASLFLFYQFAYGQTSSPTSYTVQRANNAGFTAGVTTLTVTTANSFISTGNSSGATLFYRVIGSNGTLATTSAYSSVSVTTPASGTTAATGTDLVFTNAEITQPLTLFPGPPRYYQGTAGIDWASGGNTGLANTKLPSGGDGWVSFQYTSATQLAIGFDSLNVVAGGGYAKMRVGAFVYNNNLGVVRDGALVNVAQVPAVGSYVRVRRAISGGVASYFVEYSANGSSWTNITPAPVAPATKYFTLATTGDLFVRPAINADFILVLPTSSTNFVAR